MGISFITDDCITIANESNFDFERTDPFSLGGWFNTSINSVACLIAKVDVAPNVRGWQALIRGDINGTLQFGLISNSFGGNFLSFRGTTDVTDGNWHMFFMTYDGSSTAAGAKIYLDSVLETKAAITDNLSATILNNIAPSIGCREQLSDSYFNGQITEMLVWDIEFSQADITLLYKSRTKYISLQVQQSNLVASWPMDDGANGTSADGDTVRDISGNGNNGTGDNGANNTGLTWKAEEALSYPVSPMMILEGNQFPIVDAGADKYVFHYGLAIPFSDATFSDDDGTVDHAYIDINGGGFTEIEQGSYTTLLDAVQAYAVKFPTVGAITVTLKVEDNDGATSQDTTTMNVLTIDADDVLEINGIKYDVIDGVNWDREDHHLKIPVVKRV